MSVLKDEPQLLCSAPTLQADSACAVDVVLISYITSTRINSYTSPARDLPFGLAFLFSWGKFVVLKSKNNTCICCTHDRKFSQAGGSITTAAWGVDGFLLWLKSSCMFFGMVHVGAVADFTMQGCTKPCLCDTVGLQIISFCSPKSASLRHLYLHDLSVTLSFISKHVTLSISWLWISCLLPQFCCMFFSSAVFLGSGESRTDIIHYFGLVSLFVFLFFHGWPYF